MVQFSSAIRDDFIRLSESIRVSLLKTKYNLPESANVCIKSILESLLPNNISKEQDIEKEIRDLCLCCAALASVEDEKEETLLSWIPKHLSIAAKTALEELSNAFFGCVDEKELNLQKLVIELMPEVLPLLKETIKESSIDGTDVDNEISAASARTPVGYAIVAAYQFRWFVTQVSYPHLGKLCSLMIPCALTTLDHWSPAVKGQGMLSFIHLAKNVNAAELEWYEDVILDICCRNIASDDMLWHHVVEMLVLLLTSIQKKNPRSSWFEKMMNEMLSHLERQPRNKERYTAWLELIEPVFIAMGLVLVAHFRRIFPLLFQWMHNDDDRTILLVLQRTHTIIKLTWIRNTPYIERLVDHLTNTYKEASMRRAREEIRKEVLQMLILLHKCKGLQFEATWNKYRDDPNLSALTSLFCTENIVMVA
ncbi:hypothetical protein AQUCO_00900774v1 [Aquilegia coerulea]|uniref:Uncharacterized protein n=2 Tax=Aquilegia coerulea TaxID=218851 RepID=A0A2G5EFV6_AQUCA|nr:hypothetical protein AQUCO_00900774v1 [Aquilegia coerulea]PIA54458.1 hypothetical protein AQUCO_00900774v1 [Aquilegia coerulea]PIA54459.1 hypothetical protein AQUCO_00900774v1 [Aquilegia coerulea]